MKNRQKNVALVAAGIMLGATIAGPAAQAAEMLTAQRSSQKIYVDGQQTQIEAYSINGANYVKLREVGNTIKNSTVPRHGAVFYRHRCDICPFLRSCSSGVKSRILSTLCFTVS